MKWKLNFFAKGVACIIFHSVLFGVVMNAASNTNSSSIVSKMVPAAQANSVLTTNASSDYLVVEVGRPIDGYTTSGSYVKELVWIGVRGRTNLTAYQPLPVQAFEVQLFDEKGKEIKKTGYGREFGKTLKPDKKLLNGSFANDVSAMYGHSREMIFNYGAGNSHLWDLELAKAFKIDEPGDYRLQVTVRLFVKDTNGVFSPFILPPVNSWIKTSGGG